MSEIRANTISAANGTDPVTLTKQSAAKAWINLNGSGTIESRDSFNVASLYDNGTGSYKINVTNDFSSDDHAPTVSGATANGRNNVLATDNRTFNTLNISITVSSWTIGTADYAASAYNLDSNYLMSNSHGDLA